MQAVQELEIVELTNTDMPLTLEIPKDSEVGLQSQAGGGGGGKGASTGDSVVLSSLPSSQAVEQVSYTINRTTYSHTHTLITPVYNLLPTILCL